MLDRIWPILIKKKKPVRMQKYLEKSANSVANPKENEKRKNTIEDFSSRESRNTRFNRTLPFLENRIGNICKSLKNHLAGYNYRF